MLDLIGILLSPLLWCLDWMYHILVASGALGVFLGFFAAGAVVRFLVKPFVGSRSKVGDN